jgi:hypothetical protein
VRNRTAAITGTHTGLFETAWVQDSGHRPNFVTRRTEASVQTMPEVHISEWAAKNGARVSGTEVGEGGVRALDAGVPAIPREQLQAVPDAEWQQHKVDFIYESWVERARAASLTR